MTVFRRYFVPAAVILACSFAAQAAVTVPPDITAEATGPGGAVVTFSATGEGDDDFNGRPSTTVHCSPASGSHFPLGTTTVQCTGSDQSTGSFDVTVVDTTGPALLLPEVVNAQSSGNEGTTVTYDASAIDLVDGFV
ncbi:MAG: hypothetical protein ACLGH0_06325, partial [Thermoanaerobaculia bacterium]